MNDKEICKLLYRVDMRLRETMLASYDYRLHADVIAAQSVIANRQHKLETALRQVQEALRKGDDCDTIINEALK